MLKTVSILVVTGVPVLATVNPVVVFEFDSMSFNVNYFIASILGWIFGWVLNPKLTGREITGALIVALITTLYIGSGIANIVSGTFLDHNGFVGLIIFLLTASGLPLFVSTINVVKNGTPELIKRFLDGLYKGDK